MRQLIRNNKQILQLIESSLIVLFFIQALRYLVSALYSRLASVAIVSTLQTNSPELIPEFASASGFVTFDTVNMELSFIVYMVALPLLTIFIGRFRPLMIFAAILTVGGRTLMLAEIGITPITAAAMTIGGGLLYVTFLARHHMNIFASSFIVAIIGDQLFRAAGNTLDITWSPQFLTIQMGLSAGVLGLGLINIFGGRLSNNSSNASGQSVLTLWGGISLGAILFLELSLLSTANAVVGRGSLNYPLIVPALIAATALPLLPLVQSFARQVIGLFDAAVRGWIWLLIVYLFLVLGTRFTGIFAAIGFVGAQFTVSMWWWWLLRTQTEKERNWSGVWIVLGAVTFTILTLFDTLTYEYAYIRNTALGSGVLNDTITPFLRGFRGLGYAVILFGALLAALPMIQTQKRIAWRRGGTRIQNGLIFLSVIASVLGGTYLASPPLIVGVTNPPSLRIATYNIHGGYTEFYSQNLEGIAQTIEQSGADIVLLQEVEAGRLTSFGVDQPLWLARRLGMDRRFFPTNEGLQGLAVLSRVPIVFDDGELLTSVGQQTGLQRVQIQPAEGQIVTIYNTWLGLLIAGDDITSQELDQQQQLNEIINIIGQHHPNRQLGRTVFGGTFNNVPDSDLVQSVRTRGFSDPFAGSPIERSATLDRVGIRARVDYLWIYPEIAEGVGVIDTRASDHKLAFVSIALN